MKINRLAFIDHKEFAQPSTDSQARVAPETILLLKYGNNIYTKEGHKGEFSFTDNDADSIIADFATRGKDLVIDYEHQTLNGSCAPAAGWISSLSKTAEGLVAKVKYWTDQASKYLQNGEYRYFSPVLYFSRSGKSVSAIHSVAITNHPALHNIPALVADDMSADAEMSDEIHKNTKNEKENSMRELIKMLGVLSLADASAEQQMQGIRTEVQKLIEIKKGTDEFLKLHDSDSLDKVTGKIQGMCPLSEKIEMEKQLRRRDAENTVAKVFSEGKLAEKSRKWALSFAEKDIAAFKEWAESAPVIIPDNKNIDGIKPVQREQAFSDAEMKIFRTLGLTDAQIAKIKENK